MGEHAAVARLALMLLIGALTGGRPSGAAEVQNPNLSVASVPMMPGLVITGAASERQGDYESTLTVDSVDPDGALHLTAAAEIPDPSGGKPRDVINVFLSVFHAKPIARSYGKSLDTLPIQSVTDAIPPSCAAKPS